MLIFEFEFKVVPWRQVSSLPMLLSLHTLLVQSEREKERDRESEREGKRGDEGREKRRQGVGKKKWKKREDKR